MIRIVSLIDNVTDNPNLSPKHGLSIYIQSDRHRILFDTGPDSSFIDNADRLGIDLTKVDTLVISHGHYDHGGGIADFLRINRIADVYIKKDAFNSFYTADSAGYRYIGIDEELVKSHRFVFTDGKYEIDSELLLFSGVSEHRLYSHANDSLFVKKGNCFEVDDFGHEQYLVISDNRHTVLLTGCSHNGIVNIISEFRKKYGCKTDITVIGGFHLFDNARKQYEGKTQIEAVAEELSSYRATYYTGHCTGVKPYDIMKNIIGDKLFYFSTGKDFILE